MIYSTLLGAVLIFLFRKKLMRVAGEFLICEDVRTKVDALVVLSGGAYDRGIEAARLYCSGTAPLLICPGENLVPDFQAVGTNMSEGELTRQVLLRHKVLDTDIVVVPEGVSTAGEARAILKYCREHKIAAVLVVSHKFHTRRAKSTFLKIFKMSGIKVSIHGAGSSLYCETQWWMNSVGLQVVNNEYIKLIYYLIKRP